MLRIGRSRLAACMVSSVSEAVVVKVAHGRQIGRQCIALPRLQLLDEEVDVFADEPLRRVFTARRAVAAAVAVVAALIFHCFCLCLPWGGVFFFHPRAKRRKKRTHRQTEQNESGDGGRPERWARQVPNTLDRLARGRRLPERTEKARSLGRPPEWLEVGPGRAQRILAFVLGLKGQAVRFGGSSE